MGRGAGRAGGGTARLSPNPCCMGCTSRPFVPIIMQKCSSSMARDLLKGRRCSAACHARFAAVPCAPDGLPLCSWRPSDSVLVNLILLAHEL